MSNNGVNYGGEGSNFQNAQITTTNTVTIKKSHFAIGLTISVSIVIALLLFIVKPFSGGEEKVNILGTWSTDDGKYIEFLSDGTIKTDMHYVSVKPNTYEILSDGYLKWGEYDAAWIQYFYTYYKLEVRGNNMTLTSKEDVTEIIKLTKQ